MSQRTDRVDELLREEIGAILARDVADPRIGFATITDVKTTPDLRHARVWVSVIGSDDERTATLAALDRAMGYVRHELGGRLRIRRIPELHVRLDESAERGTRVLRLLSELDAGRVPADIPEGETLPTPVARIRHPGDAMESVDEEAVEGAPETGIESRGETRSARAGSSARSGGATRVRPPGGGGPSPGGRHRKSRPAGGKRPRDGRRPPSTAR